MATSSELSLGSLVWEVKPLLAFLPEWLAIKNDLTSSTTQKFAWVSHWQAHVNPDCICVIVRNGETIESILTLEVIKQGPLTVAIFPGGQHANENFPCATVLFSKVNAAGCCHHVKAIVREVRPDIDAVHLHRQVAVMGGLENPFLPPDRKQQTDIALSLHLNNDFQVILDARDSTKKQKKIRKMGRRLEERGGWSYDIIGDKDEAKSALSQFFVLKARRLAGKGITNVFAETKVQTFFTDLFLASIEHATHEFEMHVLKVNNETVGVTGNSRNGGRFNVEFTAVDDTDPTVSYGEFLYYHMISTACSRGIHTFSFGVGDEPFKRSWCNIETAQYNCSLALTWRGRIASRIETIKTDAKRFIKSHKQLYQWLKQLRKFARKSLD